CHQLHTVSEATEDSPRGSAFPTFIPFHDPGRTMGGVSHWQALTIDRTSDSRQPIKPWIHVPENTQDDAGPPMLMCVQTASNEVLGSLHRGGEHRGIVQ
ncbi:hypothetical protein FRC03_010661, partial [Tulasnella sp. 419]